MKKSYLLFVSVLVLICAFAFAQSGSSFEKLRPAGPASSAILRPRPPIIHIPPPQIVIVGAKNLKPIAISDLDVDIQIVGNLAMTTYDMTFKNPNASLLEGEFIMPLGENQTVAALALDINGKMRDGVAVEKEKARKTFEAIVRAGADPALVEKTSGNQFRTRIYPFNANGTRRVKVTIEEPLSAKGDNYVYYLPLQFGQKLNFKIQAEVENKQTALPQTEGDLSTFRFSKAGEVYKAVFESKDYTLNNKISFLMPKNKSTPVFTHKNAAKTYFYGDVSVKKSEKAKTLPKKIAIIWDTTLSGEKRDKEKELELLNAYFKKLKTADVSFSTFKLKQDKSKKFMIRDSNWDDLKKEIESVVYDGATRLDGIDLKNTKTDEILLFTDALSTLGSTELNAGSAPIIVINSSPEFDRGAAVNAARKTGGSFINLAATPLDEAVNTLTKQSVRLIRYEYKTSDFENITPAQSGGLKENFTFAGILKTNQSEITLVFGYDDKNITETKKITVSAGGDNPAVMRLWAQQRIRELELNKEKNEEAIKALGKEFSVVTDYTSLLVLEELSDYIRYEITPPAELAGAYNQALQNKRKDAQAKEQSIFESAIAEVKEIKDWWEKDFKAAPPSKPYERLNDNSDEPFVAASFGQPLDYIAPLPRLSLASESDAEMIPPPSMAPARTSARSSARTMSRGIPAENKQSATVSLQAWNPDTPYLKILKQSSDSELYEDYLKIKRGYEDQPSFYFDVSDEFVKRKMNDKALIVLSNIAEMKLDNVELLRILGNKLLQLGYNKYAVDIFEQVVKLGGENPQPYRDLALAYQADGQYQKALDNLYKIMLGSWDGRFGKLKQIIFVEMNDIIARYKVNTSKINKEFIFKMPVDIRITLGWSSDSTDIDLHVTDPYNETAYFGHRLTAGGGHMSNDITQGFGPEEFMIKKALEGAYKIKTNNFSDSRQSVSGPVTLYLDIFTFYGTDKETHQRILVRTENVKEDNIIGSIDFSNSDIEQENKSEKENTDSNIKRKFKSLFGVK